MDTDSNTAVQLGLPVRTRARSLGAISRWSFTPVQAQTESVISGRPLLRASSKSSLIAMTCMRGFRASIAASILAGTSDVENLDLARRPGCLEVEESGHVVRRQGAAAVSTGRRLRPGVGAAGHGAGVDHHSAVCARVV